MAAGRIIKVRGKQLFLTRNTLKGNGRFAMCKGTIYILYDERGVVWLKVALSRMPGYGIVATDLASGLVIALGIVAKTYGGAVRKVVQQYRSLVNAMRFDYYKEAVEQCQKLYNELREVGILK